MNTIIYDTCLLTHTVYVSGEDAKPIKETTFQIDEWEMDRAIGKYLPNSPAGLRELIANKHGLSGADYAANTVTALLIVLADRDREWGE